MPRKRTGEVGDPKAPAGTGNSLSKEKPLASRNVGLPQPSQPPPTVQALPAPQNSQIPEDPPLAQPGSTGSTVLAPSNTPDLWQNPQPVLAAETGISPAANRR